MQRPHGLAGAVVEESFDHAVQTGLDDDFEREATLGRATGRPRRVADGLRARQRHGLEADRRAALVAALPPLRRVLRERLLGQRRASCSAVSPSDARGASISTT